MRHHPSCGTTYMEDCECEAMTTNEAQDLLKSLDNVVQSVKAWAAYSGPEPLMLAECASDAIADMRSLIRSLAAPAGEPDAHVVDLQTSFPACAVVPAFPVGTPLFLGPQAQHGGTPAIHEVAQIVGDRIVGARQNPMKSELRTQHEVRELLRVHFPKWS